MLYVSRSINANQVNSLLTKRAVRVPAECVNMVRQIGSGNSGETVCEMNELNGFTMLNE